MNKNIRKALKVCIIGGSVCIMDECIFALGKGHTLGLLRGANISAEEAHRLVSEALAEQKGLKKCMGKLILKMSDFENKKERSKKIKD